MRNIDTKSLIGMSIELQGAFNFDNTPMLVTVEDAIECYNYSFIIINNKFLLTITDAYKLLHDNKKCEELS